MVAPKLHTSTNAGSGCSEAKAWRSHSLPISSGGSCLAYKQNISGAAYAIEPAVQWIAHSVPGSRHGGAAKACQFAAKCPTFTHDQHILCRTGHVQGRAVRQRVSCHAHILLLRSALSTAMWTTGDMCTATLNSTVFAQRPYRTVCLLRSNTWLDICGVAQKWNLVDEHTKVHWNSSGSPHRTVQL